MLANAPNLDLLFRGFKASFDKGFAGAPSQYGQVAMTVASMTRETTYGWMKQLPKMREWVGDRVINGLATDGFTITNKKFELTISVRRDDIEDDQYGVFGPLMEEMGRSTRENPDELVFALLAQGFQTRGYDGQYFFDTDHPVTAADGETVTNVANRPEQLGDGPAWFLLDTSRPIKPLVFQERVKPAFQKLDDDGDANVFSRDEYVYGVRARHNVGFGLWQLAYGSKQPLTADTYAAARSAMMTMRGDNGRVLGIRPDALVVPPALEGAARKIVSNALSAQGGTNEWAGTATPIVSAWLG